MRKVIVPLTAFLILTACSNGPVKGPATADARASAETVKMLAGLKDEVNKGIMFGHQDDLAYGIGWVSPGGESDIRRVTSDYPAVYGMDLGDIEHGTEVNLDSVPFEQMKAFAREIWSRGGVITFSWHVDNPLTGGTAWDVSSGKVVNSVLPGGICHDKYREWLDSLAGFMTSLTDEKGVAIPVIFRPYHEHTGSWFWWGQDLCTDDEFIALWRFTFNYLCGEKGLHNLLFAYSAAGGFEDREQYMQRYPGDEYVDLVGFDYYQMPDADSRSFIDAVSRGLDIVTGVAAEHGKLAALTEAGFESIPDSTWWTGTLWPAIKDYPVSYVLVWRNAHNKPGHFYAPYPGQVSANDFLDFYNLPATLFQKDITGLDIYK
jgi:mannan endo-1,4-beta-mannosidase